MTDTLAVLGFVVAIAATLITAWQSREVAKQTRLSNALAGTSTLAASLEHLHAVLLIFIERPELRPYFYGGRQAPVDGLERERVLALSEFLIDVIESTLHATRVVEAFREHADDWDDYARFLLGSSPSIREHLSDHPRWAPILASLLPII